MKKHTVWEQLKDELKSVLEISTDYLEKLAVVELKKKESYTDVTYGTFNTIKGCYVRLGNNYSDAMFFVDFLKEE